MPIHSFNENNSLFEEWRKGEESAFEQLFNGLFPPLLAFANKMLRNEVVAEEIVMDVFLKIWQGKNDLLIRDIDQYLYKSVKFRIIDHYRKEKVALHPLESVDVNKYHAPACDEPMLTAELENQYQYALEMLSPKRREVFELSRLHGLSYREIANKTGLSLNTVENHVSASLRILRSRLSKVDITLLFFISSFFLK